MPDDVKPGQSTGDVNPSPSQDVKPDQNAIPYARFKEVNDKLNALIAENEKRAEAERKAQDEKLLEEKKYAELLKARESELATERARIGDLSQQLKYFQDSEKALRTELLEQIKDENDKAIAADLSTPNLRKFVERLKADDKGSPSMIKGQTKGNAGDNPYLRQASETWAQYQSRVSRLRNPAK